MEPISTSPASSEGSFSVDVDMDACDGFDEGESASIDADEGKEIDLTSYHCDQEACRDALARMLVIDELPFSVAQGYGFKRFISYCCPKFEIPSTLEIVRDIIVIYKTEKQKLHAYFQSNTPRVTLTTDTWITPQGIDYLRLTAHFIDDEWVLHRKVLNMCPFVDDDGEYVSKEVEACLLAWGLNGITAMSVDNATSAGDTVINHLSMRMNLLSGKVLGGRFMHMRCISHVISLIVRDFIEMLEISVERVRFALRYIIICPTRLAQFMTCVTQAGIDSKKLPSLDVRTRWDSTYLMLKGACKLEKAFEKYEILDPTLQVRMKEELWKDETEPLGMLTYRDWAELNSIMPFLELFYDLVIRVSSSWYVTSNLILDNIGDIFHLIRGGQSSDNADMKNMACKMKDKYDKYFGDIAKLNIYIFISPIFDPRRKLDYVNFVLAHIYPPHLVSQLQSYIKQALDELFVEYVKLYGASNAPISLLDSSVNDAGKPTRGVMRAAFKKMKCNQKGSVESELETYLKEYLEEDQSSFDLLSWWSKNGYRFPVVSRMARDILANPISTVSSKYAFSVGERVLSDFRSSLSTTMVQCLVCTKDWLKERPSANADLEKFQMIEEESSDSDNPEEHSDSE